MPRLTTQDYLTHRRLLIEEWFEHDANAFAEVPFQAQHDLHDFYAPTEPLSDAEALKHRTAMTEAYPALPQKAGRAFQTLLAVRERKAQRVVRTDVPRAAPRGDARTRGVRIAAVVRPTPDVPLLAKALLRLALDDWDAKHPDVHLDEKLSFDVEDDLSHI